MVFLMTGPEVDVVEPAEEAEDAQEELVEEFGTKDGAVTEFMEAVEEECVKGAMQEEGDEEAPPEPRLQGKPGGRACQRQKAQMPERLQKAEQIAALIEFGEDGTIDGGSIPRDLGLCGSVGHGRRSFPLRAYGRCGCPRQAGGGKGWNTGGLYLILDGHATELRRWGVSQIWGGNSLAVNRRRRWLALYNRLWARRSAGARPGRTVESVSWGGCEGRHKAGT